MRRAGKAIQILLEHLSTCGQLPLRLAIAIVARLVDLVASCADIQALDQTHPLLRQGRRIIYNSVTRKPQPAYRGLTGKRGSRRSAETNDEIRVHETNIAKRVDNAGI